MQALIFGGGGLGRAIETALVARRDTVVVMGRPDGRPHHVADDVPGSDVVFEVSRGEAVLPNVRAALGAGCRGLVIGTTGWDGDRDEVAGLLDAAGVAAVAAPNLALGAALFLRLVEAAAPLFGAVDTFDPFLVEWHRRAKTDRPSGTALEIARRLGAAARPGERRGALEIASIRAGTSPGQHVLGWDAPGEVVELRLAARDRSAYATGALAAADWLLREPRRPGLHSFDPVVDELLAQPVTTAA